MKKLIFLSLLLSVALLFISCQGDTNTQPEVTTGNEETVAETATTVEVTSNEETVLETVTIAEVTSAEETVAETVTTEEATSDEETVVETVTTAEVTSNEKTVLETVTIAEVTSAEETVAETVTTEEATSDEETVAETVTTAESTSNEETVEETVTTAESTSDEETVAETVTTADVTSAEETVDEIISTTEYDTSIDEDVTIMDDKNSEIISIPEYDTVINEPLPDKTIEVRNIDRLNEMRKMLTCDDESQWNQYIESVSDCGIESKDDILIFVKLIDALPQISILDGDITWIYFSHGISEDTGKEATVVYITTKAKNGDWTRIEYVLSITDVSKKISDERESIGDNSVLNNFVKSLDGDLTLYIETREPHPSDKGTMIQWVGHAKGIFTRIYYYTSNPSDINADNLFGNIQFE